MLVFHVDLLPILSTLVFEKFSDDVSAENFVHDYVEANENIDPSFIFVDDNKLVLIEYECVPIINQYSSSSLSDYEGFEMTLPLKMPNLKDNIQLSIWSLDEKKQECLVIESVCSTI